MMVRTQFAHENKPPRRTHQLVVGLARPDAAADVTSVFDLGSSGASDIAQNKRQMIGDAFNSAHKTLSPS